MRALVPVAIVAIIAFTVLVVVLTDRRRRTRRTELERLRGDLTEAKKTILALNRQTTRQEQTGVPDLWMLRQILDDYLAQSDLPTYPKEADR